MSAITKAFPEVIPYFAGATTAALGGRFLLGIPWEDPNLIVLLGSAVGGLILRDLLHKFPMSTSTSTSYYATTSVPIFTTAAAAYYATGSWTSAAIGGALGYACIFVSATVPLLMYYI